MLELFSSLKIVGLDYYIAFTLVSWTAQQVLGRSISSGRVVSCSRCACGPLSDAIPSSHWLPGAHDELGARVISRVPLPEVYPSAAADGESSPSREA